MTCDRRNTLFAPINTFDFTINDRVRRYSTSDKQDLETIYEVKIKQFSIFFLLIIQWLNNYYASNVR